MFNSDWATVCGAYCGNCEDLAECGGCAIRVAKAQPGSCDQYVCCTQVKKLEHCGLCDEFPCERINVACSRLPQEFYQHNLDSIVRTLRRRSQVGTTAWLREVHVSDGSD